LRWNTEQAVANGTLAADAAAAWLSSLEAANAAGQFFAVITSFLVSGRKR
jgi:hypothetical protein